ncbi:hypothetical protein OBBRIDRAFT_884398 [Obba rivulosa]|uniref:4a-hydroxytetrahydrobiopterin dehydratase n=1 Tax=Obba rivulosa TaxID=1052685 RepID=A0A8E2J594_9APHY|nr:hypothetical protein OBBRIDRAFT_884398 [Obba rivulosa]
MAMISCLARRRVACQPTFHTTHLLAFNQAARRVHTVSPQPPAGNEDEDRIGPFAALGWQGHLQSEEQKPRYPKVSPYGILHLRLPDLPPKPPLRKASAHLSSNEIRHFLRPLYVRFWSVISSLEAYGVARDYTGRDREPSPELVKAFPFATNAFAVKFLMTVMGIAEQEGHHPTHVTLRNRIVEFRMHTHSAVPGIEQSMPEGNVPGITLRDVRLAYLMENAYVHALLSREAWPPRAYADLSVHPHPTTASQLERMRWPLPEKTEQKEGAPGVNIYPPREDDPNVVFTDLNGDATKPDNLRAPEWCDPAEQNEQDERNEPDNLLSALLDITEKK